MAITDPAMKLPEGTTRQDRRTERINVWQPLFASYTPGSQEDADRVYDSVLDWMNGLGPEARAVMERNLNQEAQNLGWTEGASAEQQKAFVYNDLGVIPLLVVPNWVPPNTTASDPDPLVWLRFEFGTETRWIAQRDGWSFWVRTWEGWPEFYPTAWRSGGSLVGGPPQYDRFSGEARAVALSKEAR